MPNIVTDSGFENGVAWSYSAGASRSDLAAHGGTWSARIPRAVGELTGGMVEQVGMIADVGETYDVTLWVNGDAALGQALRIDVDPGTGAYAELGTVVPASGWFEWAPGSFVASGLVGVRLVNLSPVSGRVWFVDDVSIDSGANVATRRRQIIDAILARLATITVANGYTTTLASVVEGPRRHEVAGGYPHVQLVHVGGSKETSTESYRATLQQKACALAFEVWIYAKDSATSGALIADDVHSDVEKALEKETYPPNTASAILGLGFVRGVDVGEPDPAVDDDAVERDITIWRVPVTVRYVHMRGQP